MARAPKAVVPAAPVKASKPLAEGEVRIAEVYTPNDGFNGFRLGVKFVDGRAQLPEPVVTDFHHLNQYETEHKAWEVLVERMVTEYDYEIHYSIVKARDEDDEDAEFEDAPLYQRE